MSSLLIERHDAVLHLTMNRPQRSNALTTEMLVQITEAVTSARVRGARAMLLTGAGRNFCSGAETGLVASAEDREEFVKRSWEALAAIADAPVPVVGALNGPAVAGGVEIALSCDLRVAHSSAYLRPRGLDWGAVTCSRMSRFLPLGLTTQLVWLQQKLPAAEALRWGLVTEVVDSHDELMANAMALAQRLADYPTDAVLRSRALLRNLADSWQRMIELQAEATDAGWSSDTQAAREAVRKAK